MISARPDGAMGISGYISATPSPSEVGGRNEGVTLGWDPNLALFAAIAITTALGLLMCAVAARRRASTS